MLKITAAPGGDKSTIMLSGTIDETDKFDVLVPKTGVSLRVNCAGVEKINSLGIKSWIQYFTDLQKRNVRVQFEDASTVLVEVFNEIENFFCDAELVSVMVPFACEKCGERTEKAMKVADLPKSFPLTPVSCVHCGAKAAFDDIEEEYFLFVRRRAKQSAGLRSGR